MALARGSEVGPDRDPLGDREQAGDVGHRVGGRPDRDSAIAGGLRCSLHRGLRVELRREGARSRLDAAWRPPQNCRGSDLAGLGVDGHGTQPLVDGLAVREGQDGGLPDQQRGHPFTDLSSGQQSQRVGHLGHRRGEAEVTRSLRGGHPCAPAPPGQRCPDRSVADDALRVLLAALGVVEGHGDAGLGCSRDRLEPLEEAQLVDRAASSRQADCPGSRRARPPGRGPPELAPPRLDDPVDAGGGHRALELCRWTWDSPAGTTDSPGSAARPWISGRAVATTAAEKRQIR